jgi:hypothetical protein
VSKKRKKLDDDQIKVIIEHEIGSSLGFGGELFEQRRKSIDYYYGDKFGNEVEGRSQVVSTDVSDVIEWMMPSLMRIFTSGDEIGRFDPTGPEDVKAAQQESMYVNYVLNKDNDGFKILYDWFKDALMLKNGITKVWWDETEVEEREEYTELTDFQYQALVTDKNVTVVEHSTMDDEDAMDAGLSDGDFIDTNRTHDLVITRKGTEGKIKIVVCPPEQFYISKQADSIEDANFLGDRMLMTISELREMGFKDVDDIVGSDEQWWSEEYTARRDYDDSGMSMDMNPGIEGSERKIWVDECYLKIDANGDGISEWVKVLKAGDRILSRENVDGHPYISLTPIPMPHKFYGLSLADLTMDLQLIKSTLWRNMLDNYYMLNNGRYVMVEGQVNLDDLLTSRPGGVIREKVPGAVRRLEQPQLPNSSFTMLEYIDKVRDERTGVRVFQGLDADSLQNTTATAVSQQVTASNMKMEMVARIFAETGVKKLFLKIHELSIKHQKIERTIKLTGEEWVPIDPSEWRDRRNMTVSVGLGNGNRDQTIMNLNMLGTHISNIRQDPEMKAIVQPQNIYNLLKEAVKAMGMKNYNDFFTDPSTLPPEAFQPQGQGEDPMAQVLQQKAQADAMKAQVDMQKAQINMQELQEEVKQNQFENKLDVSKGKLDEHKLKLDIEKLQFEKEQLIAEIQMFKEESRLKIMELGAEIQEKRSIKIGE